MHSPELVRDVTTARHEVQSKGSAQSDTYIDLNNKASLGILAEGAIALPVALSGGALFAS